MAKINDKFVGTPKDSQIKKVEALQQLALEAKKKYKNKPDKPERLRHAEK